MINPFKKEKNSGRASRELLRENLSLLQIDMFDIQDPILKLNDAERIIYLKSFFDLFKDMKLIERIKYNINRQAQKTLGNAKDGVQDTAGAANINGLAFVMDDIERLANQYIKETTKPPEQPLDKFEIIPKVG